MPDLLIFSKDNKSIFELEELGKQKNFRVKSTVQLETARDWLRFKDFDVVFVDVRYPIDEQQALAGILWEKNIVAPFVTYDLDAEVQQSLSVSRLFGADLAIGMRAKDTLSRILDSVNDAIPIKHQDFNIMVVEDLDSPRDIICQYVEKLGFATVVGQRSAKEAISELEAKADYYSCVITDIRMPEMNGEELIYYLRDSGKFKHLPIIVLTAYGTIDALTDCLKAGASGFLVKPPRKDALTYELSRAMRIISQQASPRLVQEDEVDLIRQMLEEKGIV